MLKSNYKRDKNSNEEKANRSEISGYVLNVRKTMLNAKKIQHSVVETYVENVKETTKAGGELFPILGHAYGAA